MPNPYLGQSTYETGNTSSVIRFTNLPEQVVTIRIFTVSGSLVTTLVKDGSARPRWTGTSRPRTTSRLRLACTSSHIDVAGLGERTLKLGIINRRTQIRAF